MTTATRAGRGSAAVWFGLVAVVAVVVVLSWAGQDDRELGGFADPDGLGPDGLGALRALIDESGGSADPAVSTPTEAHDVALLALPLYVDFLSGLDGTDDSTVENHQPILEWVREGGVLVTGVDVPGGPVSSEEVVDDDDLRVGRGDCTAASVDGVGEIRPLAHIPVVVGSSDQSCFGESDSALLVERALGDGRIIRLAGFGMFMNRALDDADNGALAARTMQLGEGRSVAFLSGPVLAAGGFDGPVNEDGEPVGAGDSTLLELVPDRVQAMLIGLAVAFLLYAIAKGRRLGSPVVETVPIELASSTYVEAVGRLHRRTTDPISHSAEILRHDARSVVARKAGRAVDAPASEITAAVLPEPDEAAAFATLLDGPLPRTDDGLVSFAAELNNRRFRLERPAAPAPNPSSNPSNEHDQIERTSHDDVPARW
ncbi:MAG: DUF4350 domain-containing protein [Acidimicrobiales bacterium]